MNDPTEIATLRNLFLTAPETASTRVIAALLGVAMVSVVLWLVRRRALRAEFTPIWLVASFGLAFLALRLDVLQAITVWIGAWTPSSTVFFLGELFLVAVALHYSVRLSKATLEIKNLAQHTALLQARLEKLEVHRSQIG